MAWPTPQYSKTQVNKAGEILISPTAVSNEVEWAHLVLGNWRACHGYPINTFQATLRTRIRLIDGHALVAQRLKRTPSIILKLKRFEGMSLARMQDIGGLRAVVQNLQRVRRLQESYRPGSLSHELVSTKDYIAEPKTDGYRSLHLVFRYKNKIATEYDGLLLELQFRTRLQHAWATAVETMGIFLGQALKSRQGERRWLKFFEIAGAAFAHLEKSPLVPGYETLSRSETFRAVAKAERELKVLEKLRAFSLAVDMICTSARSGSYHLVVLDLLRRSVTITPYSLKNLEQGTLDYAACEARANSGEPIEVVLVSAGPVESLRRAYPNYFLDTGDFIARVESLIASVS